MKNQKGTILVAAIIIMTILMGLGAGLVTLALNLSVTTKKSFERIQAISLSEAGIEKTMWELNNGVSPTCTNVCNLGSGQFKVTITDIDTENKEIESIGYIPSFSNPKIQKAVTVRISASPNSEGISLSYAIQAGTGGIEVGGSSEVIGNLYSNGNISVSGSAKVVDPGETWAVGAIADTKKTAGPDHPGSPSVPLPSINTEMWKSLAEEGGTITGDYSPPNTGSYTDIGPKKITGDFSMSSSKQKINLLGPLYIQGDLTISGGEVKLDDSFGTKGTIVLVDGEIKISGGDFYGNASGAYILFISTNTANTSSNPAISYTGSANGQKIGLFAPNGAIKISGSGKIVAMTGKTLFISGNGKIEYESGMASTQFSGGPGGRWVRKWWKEE